MIEIIDEKIKKLLNYRDSEKVIGNAQLRASICTVIEKSYFLESTILYGERFGESINDQFFTAHSAINRHFRDWGLDEVADIYNELHAIAKPYLKME